MLRHADVPFVIGHVCITFALWLLMRHAFVLSPVVLVLVAATVSACVLMGIDKVAAAAGMWRVPERALYLVTLLGGSAGVLLGMRLFRHKTQKTSFQMMVFVIVLLQFAIGAWLASSSSV